LSEQAFSLTGAVDEKSMLKIGELLSAKELVVGRIRKRNDSYFHISRSNSFRFRGNRSAVGHPITKCLKNQIENNV